MKHKITVTIFSLFTALAMCACGSSLPAPDTAETSNTVEETVIEQPYDETIADDSTFSSLAETAAPTDSDGRNILVAYFSRADENYNVGTVEKGNTQIIAEYIAGEVGADSFHIETVTPYPASYDECCDTAKQELADNARPELSGTVDMEQYDIIFLGYPIWWGDMPMAVYTFMDSYDFSGKTVIPFNTHEGSGASGTYSAIESYLTDVQVPDGLAIQGRDAQEFSNETQQSVRDWLDELGF